MQLVSSKFSCISRTLYQQQSAGRHLLFMIWKRQTHKWYIWLCSSSSDRASTIDLGRTVWSFKGNVDMQYAHRARSFEIRAGPEICIVNRAIGSLDRGQANCVWACRHADNQKKFGKHFLPNRPTHETCCRLFRAIRKTVRQIDSRKMITCFFVINHNAFERAVAFFWDAITGIWSSH